MAKGVYCKGLIGFYDQLVSDGKGHTRIWLCGLFVFGEWSRERNKTITQ